MRTIKYLAAVPIIGPIIKRHFNCRWRWSCNQRWLARFQFLNWRCFRDTPFPPSPPPFPHQSLPSCLINIFHRFPNPRAIPTDLMRHWSYHGTAGAAERPSLAVDVVKYSIYRVAGLLADQVRDQLQRFRSGDNSAAVILLLLLLWLMLLLRWCLPLIGAEENANNKKHKKKRLK